MSHLVFFETAKIQNIPELRSVMTRFPHFLRGKSLLLKSDILPHHEKFFQDNNKKEYICTPNWTRILSSGTNTLSWKLQPESDTAT
ncbi:MAG: hypothetical protein SPL47_00200 [Bacteroidales bacterium]|nr:hypothetical protein [Bacteroidales bacterium]